MLSLTKPTHDVAFRLMERQSRFAFKYPDLDATTGAMPSGYDHDCARIELVEGVFNQATSTLHQWKQFQVGWAEAVPTTRRLELA